MTPLTAGDRTTIRQLLKLPHNHIVSTSPLWHHDTVQIGVKPLPDAETLRLREAQFVNDAIRTELYCRARKLPIIPVFDATRDPHSQAYFRSPLVKAVMKLTLGNTEIKQSSHPSPNKLSTRHRCMVTPREDTLRANEKNFINDAIITDKLRTKYTTIIPPYDASNDTHARRYFCRYGVRNLMKTTMGSTVQLPCLVSVKG